MNKKSLDTKIDTITSQLSEKIEESYMYYRRISTRCWGANGCLDPWTPQKQERLV